MPITLVVFIRSVIGFFLLLLFIRLIGKQQVSQLTFFDYVTGITVGSIASTLSVQVNESLTATLVGMGTWSGLTILLAVLEMHNSRIRRVIDGEPTIVIQNGRILENNLKRIRIPVEELLSELRLNGVFNIADVEFALFEPGGKLSVLKKSQKQPITPGDLNIQTEYEGIPKVLIMDGVVSDDALRSLKLSRSWLHHQLHKKNIDDISQVILAQLDAKGNLYVDLRNSNKYCVIQTKGSKSNKTESKQSRENKPKNYPKSDQGSQVKTNSGHSTQTNSKHPTPPDSGPKSGG